MLFYKQIISIIRSKQKYFIPRCPNRSRLFKLLAKVKSAGFPVVPISKIDSCIEQKKGALFLYHDVHGLDLKRLIAFAKKESKLGFFATYYFMLPEHPQTIKNYSFVEQVEAMKTIKDFGHELALHIDPFFQISSSKKKLQDIFAEALETFFRHDIQIRIGNLHGNSKYKIVAPNYCGSIEREFFEECSYLDSLSELVDIPADILDLLCVNRIKLRDFGFTHWGDPSPWSSRWEKILLNYLTDNQIKKSESLSSAVYNKVFPGYTINYAPVGACKKIPTEYFPIKFSGSFMSPKHTFFPLFGKETTNIFTGAQFIPTVFLMHPQFYLGQKKDKPAKK